MSDFLKEAVKLLHGVLVPLVSKLSDPDARDQFQQSLGYKPGENSQAPTFPSGSAMERYFNNEEKKKDDELYKQSLDEVSQIIDALKLMYQSGADAWYSIKPEDPDHGPNKLLALSELLTLTINIFTLDYFRFRYPFLHNWFMMGGVVDEMGQRTGGSAFLGKVVGDSIVNCIKGAVIPNQNDANTFVQTLALGLTIFNLGVLKDPDIFVSGGYETHPYPKNPCADEASKSILSTGWFFTHGKATTGDVYMTLGFVPKTPLGRGFFAKVNPTTNFEKPLSEHVSLEIVGGEGLNVVYIPDDVYSAVAGDSNRVSVILKFKPEPNKFDLLKSPELSIGYGNQHTVELRINHEEVGIIFTTAFSIKFGRGEATSFPFKYLPESQYEDTFPLTFGWTTKRGFFLSDAGTVGSNALPSKPDPSPPAPMAAMAGALPHTLAKMPTDLADIANLLFLNIPINKSFGGATFQNVHVGMTGSEDSTIIESSLDFTFSIGSAFILAVTRIGCRVIFTARNDMKGFLGQDIDVNVKPPTGIGMSIDTGIVKGAGFLSLDEENGSYSGALEFAIDLQFFKFNVKAFGIIQTKLPGAAEDEYSIFIVISSDFEPVPIIFGLTLNGVGGLFGHNRTVDISLIQTEMDSPYLENILFLKDPLANINRLISDAGRYFPVKTNKTLFGISMIIGYGVPSVFELRLAVIFVSPDDKIIVPGFLRLETPRKTKILHLQVNFLAILDIKEGYFFFRADLVDSRLVTFKLTGSLVFAIGWGDTDGLFAISVGGFHPSYKHFPQIKALPNAFKGLDRLRLSLWESGKNHLYLEMYLAITSNSRQLGAHAYLHVEGPWGFNIDGHLGFDILWETEPKCYFEAGIEARIDFRHNESVLAGVSLNALFTGPSPKHIEGKARLRICWFLTVSIPFSKTWGDTAPAIDEETVDLDELITAQIMDDRNWRAEIPDFHQLHVTTRTDPATSGKELIIQPLGTIVFTQRSLPLNYEIQRVGSRKAKVAKSLSINSISSNDTKFTGLETTSELFAPGQFIDLKESEKLARPSFEKMPGGVKIGDTGISNFPVPFIKAKEAAYELTYVVPDIPSPKEKTIKVLKGDSFQRLSRNSAASRNPNSWQSGRGMRTAPKQINVVELGFSIADTGTMKSFTPENLAGYGRKSQSEMEQIKNALITKNPALQGNIQVLADYELTH